MSITPECELLKYFTKDIANMGMWFFAADDITAWTIHEEMSEGPVQECSTIAADSVRKGRKRPMRQQMG
jgi:hypothetical protein